MSWLAWPNVVGTLDKGATFLVPIDEDPRAVSPRFVATARFGEDRGIGTPIPTTLLMRDARNGDVLAKAEMALGVDPQLAFAGDDLILVAHRGEGSDGVYRLSAIDGSSTELTTDDGLPRTGVVCSRKGGVAAVLVGGEFAAEIIDLESGHVSAFPIEGLPLAISDRALVTRTVDEIHAYDLASGGHLWASGGIVVRSGYMTSDGEWLVVQAGFDQAETAPAGIGIDPADVEPRVLVLGMTTGASRTLLSEADLGDAALWLDLSSDDSAALARNVHGGRPETMLLGALAVSLIKLDTGSLSRDAIVLPTVPTGIT